MKSLFIFAGLWAGGVLLAAIGSSLYEEMSTRLSQANVEVRTIFGFEVIQKVVVYNRLAHSRGWRKWPALVFWMILFFLLIMTIAMVPYLAAI